MIYFEGVDFVGDGSGREIGIEEGNIDRNEDVLLFKKIVINLIKVALFL